MFRSVRTHPDKATLLAWAEGELSWWRHLKVDRHARSCWSCRGQASELEAMVCAVGTRVAELPEPSRVDTAKAYWRFKEACLQIEAVPGRRRLQLGPAWVCLAAATLAVAGFAFVTTQQRFSEVMQKPSLPPRSTSPANPHRASAVTPPVSVAVVPEVVETNPFSRPWPAADKLAPAPPIGISDEELLTAEVQALAALHRSRFCLSSGVTVRRSGSAVVVSGYAQSREQLARLEGVLEGVANPDILHIEIGEPSSNATPLRSGPAASRRPAPAAERVAPPVESWLRGNMKVGSRLTEREMFDFMNAVVLESESVSSEAWAIRHLAEQFPAARSKQLSPFLTEQLLQIVDDHAIALGNGLQALGSRLSVLLDKPSGRPSPTLMLRPDEPWQSKVLAVQVGTEDAVSRLLESFSSANRASSAPAPPNDLAPLLTLLHHHLSECMAVAADLRASIQTMSADARRLQTRSETR